MRAFGPTVPAFQLLAIALIIGLCNGLPSAYGPVITAREMAKATIVEDSISKPDDPPDMASALQCNREHGAYSESRKTWSRQHSTWISLTTTTTETLYSTSTSVIAAAPTITLCDGVPRAGNDLASTITWTSSVFVSTRTFESVSYPDYTIPAPACSIEPYSCSEVSSYVQARPTAFPEGWNVPCNGTGYCNICVITANKVKLYHWPLPTTIANCETSTSAAARLLRPRSGFLDHMATATANDDDDDDDDDDNDDNDDHDDDDDDDDKDDTDDIVTTVVSAGTTFTSPTLYISFYDISATDSSQGLTCGGPPPTGAAAIVSFAPSAVSSVRYGRAAPQQGLYAFDAADLAHTSATTDTYTFPVPLVPSAAYHAQYGCNVGGGGTDRCSVAQGRAAGW
ncbi:hypothetical protein SLS58_001521 [Diplodia intermedia]|uniref:Uncharacterized protein n=1 Tax=Diplodia intermedia TaxID=856260 RepID=A0ABR3U1T5_9PEZI